MTEVRETETNNSNPEIETQQRETSGDARVQVTEKLPEHLDHLDPGSSNHCNARCDDAFLCKLHTVKKKTKENHPIFWIIAMFAAKLR